MKMEDVTDDEAQRRRRMVQSATGVRPKLRFMSEWYGISSDQGFRADDLYKVRNILSHNFGVVQEKHAVDGKLQLRWLGIEGWARGVQNNESLPLKKLLGTATKEDMMIEMRQVERARSFNVGEQLDLRPLDFSEIFYSAAVVSARSFLEAVADYIRGHGIPVTEIRNAEES
ncbi:MAG: hypothetical protein KF796_08800 [Ramlibacter sp.]|nr:hypothetical protein [Ramlibacter sp.]